MMPWRILVQLSQYFLGRLRGDGEFTLYRAHAKQIEPPSILSGMGESTIVNESPMPLVPEFPQHQAQRRFHLAGASLGILSRFWFPVLLPFSGEGGDWRRSAKILEF
jgi:hypothetical protein